MSKKHLIAGDLRHFEQINTDCARTFHEKLRSGDFIIYVGAGFSVPAGFPDYRTLLIQIASRPGFPNSIISRLNNGTNTHGDQILWEMTTYVSKETICTYIIDCLSTKSLPPAMLNRVDLLKKIKCKGIMTTNFDGILDLISPQTVGTPEGCNEFLESTNTGSPSTPSLPILQLLGSPNQPNSFVCTSTETQHHLTHLFPFLEKLLCRDTVIYLGCALSSGGWLPHLLEELTLSKKAKAGFAVMNDVTEQEEMNFLQKLGISVLNFDSKQTRWEGFEGWLDLLVEASQEVVCEGGI